MKGQKPRTFRRKSVLESGVLEKFNRMEEGTEGS